MPRTRKVALTEVSDTEEGTDLSDEDREFCCRCGRQLPPNADFCPKCGSERRGSRREALMKHVSPCCCACSCTVTLLVMAVVGIVVIFCFNSWLKVAIEQVGGAVLGVSVTLQSINFSLMQGRISITDLRVASPADFGRDFLKLERFVFDVSPLSLFAGYFSGFTQPIELEQVKVHDLEVFIGMEVLPNPSSNAGTIVEHIHEVTGATFVPKPMPDIKTVTNEGLRAMTAKIKVDRIELSNISATVEISGAVEANFPLNTIEIEDVGTENNGVYVYEFVAILVRSLLMGILKAAPGATQSFMAKSFGEQLSRGSLDIGKLSLDLGNGLEEISKFSGWATAEAMLLPVKMASAGASMSEKAMEIGSKLLGMQTSASMAAAKANVDIGLQATKTFGKLSTAFTQGVTNALTG